MQVIRASDMGFCWGVRRAVDMMESEAQKGQIISLGSIVHNQQVVDKLADHGVNMAHSIEELNADRVAITAHGVGPEVLERLRATGKEVIDTTCPIVTRSQRWAKKLADEGFAIVIFGDPNHKEVRGVLQWAGSKGYAITEEEIDGLPWDKMPSRVAVLSQTTHNPDRFANFVSLLLKKKINHISDLQVINTLCHATSGQQAAAEELAHEVEVMIVIGGRESANTRHLVEICEEQGVETHHVETRAELLPQWFVGKEKVGVTAGASTPDFVIDEVVAAIEEVDAVPA